ncbi:CKLF-like MARVEL transmembrane domain-containing protein 6 [Periophthalmus magnuspinnatus]|nr:CKLF-like MARVEL transmembrane domain-containing protein 6 [Periophthalmus magnuspinnatus]
MADTVYAPTTAPNPKDKCFLVPTDILDLKRFCVKLLEVLFSVVAFLQEEFVSSCVACNALYFFEFVSCTAFLFTVLLLGLLSTPVHRRVGMNCWSMLDFMYTVIIFVFFFLASIIFSASNSGSALERSAVAFGFLASLSFLLDLVLFYRTHGLPFKYAQNQENPATGSNNPAEAEKLNENGA